MEKISSFPSFTNLNLPGTPKKCSPLKNFDNFSRAVESMTKHKFYALVTHLIIQKSGKFYYIISRIDKITLLLVMANYQLRRHQKLF